MRTWLLVCFSSLAVAFNVTEDDPSSLVERSRVETAKIKKSQPMQNAMEEVPQISALGDVLMRQLRHIQRNFADNPGKLNVGLMKLRAASANMFRDADQGEAGLPNDAQFDVSQNGAVITGEATLVNRSGSRDAIGVTELVRAIGGKEDAFQSLFDHFYEKLDHEDKADQGYVDKVVKMMKGAFTAIDKFFDLADVTRISKSTKIQPMLKEDEKRGMKKLDYLDTYMNRAKGAVGQTLNQYMNTHKGNIKKMDNDIAEYSRLYDETQQVMEKIPGNLQAKNLDLKARISQEQADMETGLRDFVDMADRKEDRFTNHLVDVSTELKNTFTGLQGIAARLKKGSLNSLGDDTAAIQSEGMSAILKTRNDAAALTIAVRKQVQSSKVELNNNERGLSQMGQEGFVLNQDVDLLNERISKNAKDQMSTTRSAAAQNMDGTVDNFITNAKADEQKEISKLNAKVDMVTMQGRENAIEAATAVEKHAEPLQQQFDRLIWNQKDLGKQISRELEKSVVLNKRAVKFDAQTVQLSKFLHAAIHFADKDIVDDARNSNDAVRGELDRDVQGARKEKDDIRKQIYGQKEKSLTDFEDGMADEERDIKTAVGEKGAQITKLEQLKGQMQRNLIDKIDSTQARITETENHVLPQLVDTSKGFMNAAKVEMDEMPHETESAIDTAHTIVGQHEAGLARFVSDLISGIDNIIDPLVKKNIKILTDGKDGELDSLADTDSRMVGGIVEADETVKDTDYYNRRNQKELKSGKQDISQMFNEAQDAVALADAKLGQNMQNQEDKTKDVTQSLETEIASMVSQMSQKADIQTGQGSTKLDQNMANADESVPKRVGSMDKLVDRVTSGLYHSTNGLMKHLPTLSGILKEAQHTREKTNGMTKKKATQLNEAIRGEKVAALKGATSYTEALKAGVDKARDEERQTISSNLEKMENEIQDTEKQNDRQADKVMATQDKQAAKLNSALNAAETETEGQLKDVTEGLDAMMSRATTRQKTTEEQNADLQNKLHEIEQGSKTKSAAFEKEMANAGAELAKLVDQDHFEMKELVEKLEMVTDRIKTGVETQEYYDKSALQELLVQASAHTQGVMTKLQSTEERVQNVLKNLGEVERSANSALADSQRIANTFEGNVGDTARRFVRQLGEEQGKRKAAAAKLVKETKQNVQDLQPLAETVMKLQTKLAANVEYQLTSVELEEKKIDRELKDSVGLRAYQDADAVHRVMAKAKDVQAKEERIQQWKEHADKLGDRFKAQIKQEFMKLGEEIDMAELDEAEQKAMEQWAVQSQMSHLKETLGQEVHDLGKVSKGRLATLAQSTGGEIAAMMADETLTEEERAYKLAEVKKKAADAAKKILEEDDAMKLDARTAARSLRVATESVEDSGKNIAASTAKITPAAGLSHKLDSIKDLLSTVQSTVDNSTVMSPTSQLQVGPTSMVEAAQEESTATLRGDEGLLQDVNALIQQLH